MTVSAWLSAVAKNSKSDDPNGHRFCDKKSVTQKVSKTPCAAQLPFSSLFDLFRMLPCFGLCFAWFVGLLTYPFMCGEFFSHKRIVSAFSLSHDSSSNDRFSSHAGISRMENNTLESQLLSESCRVLAISNVQTADPATDSFRVRDSHPIPLFSEQACVSD